MSHDALNRILREHGSDLLEVLADRLSPTDLQTLLLEVFRQRAERQPLARLLESHRENRFVRPSVADPRTFLEFDRLAFQMAEPEFEPIELSPLAPLGTTSAVTTVSQNNLVSTARNVEVMADPTNVMALECAVRREELLRTPEGKTKRVRLCCSHRLVRAQPTPQPRSWAHFRLFALTSGGRDEGSYRFESEELALHIGFYLKLFAELRANGFTMGSTRVAITNFGGEAREVAFEALLKELAAEFPETTFAPYPDRESGQGYYDGFCFHIYVTDRDGAEHFVVDGGIVDWTQRLLNNHKERFAISGIGTERLCSVFA